MIFSKKYVAMAIKTRSRGLVVQKSLKKISSFDVFRVKYVDPGCTVQPPKLGQHMGLDKNTAGSQGQGQRKHSTSQSFRKYFNNVFFMLQSTRVLLD